MNQLRITTPRTTRLLGKCKGMQHVAPIIRRAAQQRAATVQVMAIKESNGRSSPNDKKQMGRAQERQMTQLSFEVQRQAKEVRTLPQKLLQAQRQQQQQQPLMQQEKPEATPTQIFGLGDLAAVAAVVVALVFGLITTINMNTADIKSVMKASTTELNSKITELTSDMKASTAELKSDMKASTAELNSKITELKSDMKASTSDINSKITELKSDMKASTADINSKITELTSVVRASLNK